jgi:hypothetical protein
MMAFIQRQRQTEDPSDMAMFRRCDQHIVCGRTQVRCPPCDLKSTASRNRVRFEVITAVTMKIVFWDIKPSSYLTGDTLRLRYKAQPVNAM